MAEKNFRKKKQSKVAKAARHYVEPTDIKAGGRFEYKMPEALYQSLLKECKKNRAGDAPTYLCNYVNEQLGLLGTCVRVIPF